jgi:hypothetical protein
MKRNVYPVGLLHDIRRTWATIRARVPDVSALEAVRRLGRDVRKHWRRRSYWNGYLAEPTEPGEWTRCGHGWTRARAERDLDRHLRRTGHVA